MWFRATLFFAVLALMWVATFGGTVQYLSPGIYRAVYAPPIPPRPVVCLIGCQVADPVKMKEMEEQVRGGLARQNAWDMHSKSACERFASWFPHSRTRYGEEIVRDSGLMQLLIDQVSFRWARTWTDCKHFLFESANFGVALALAWLLPIEWSFFRKRVLMWPHPHQPSQN